MPILWRSICSEVRPFASSCSIPLTLCLSDLLSRHVNKCHANEKPLPSTGARKKGSASVSRATTSKQVCDQCVQANSSCDGSNPCGKSFSLLSLYFLSLIFQIQQNAFNVDFVALSLNSTVKRHHWVQDIPSVRVLNRPSPTHQALTLYLSNHHLPEYLPHHHPEFLCSIIHHFNNNPRMISSSVHPPT